METTTTPIQEDLGLLSKIRPPRLEDAGLEDCALPPSSIHAAFLKAASILSGDGGAGGCVADPWPEKSSPPSDALVGIVPEGRSPGPCATGKGGGAVVGGGDVVVGGGEMAEDKDDVVVVGGGGESGGGGGRDCVDGLAGLEIKDGDEVNDDDPDVKPTLVEGYFFNA